MEFCIHSWLFLIDSKYKYYRATKSLDLRQLETYVIMYALYFKSAYVSWLMNIWSMVSFENPSATNGVI